MSTEQLIDTNNICNICNTKNVLISSCRNCDKYMCSYDSCGMHFKHVNNTLYSICNTCVNIINNKFIILYEFI